MRQPVDNILEWLLVEYDEAEIRGQKNLHRSLPGKIIHGMKKASTVNPLFLLDEIDKLGNDYRGILRFVRSA